MRRPTRPKPIDSTPDEAFTQEKPHVLLSPSRRRAVTAGVMLGMFLAALEATVVGTAMPTIIAKLGGLDHYSWVFSAYLLTSTVTVPVWGRLSDLFGRRPLYLAAVAVLPSLFIRYGGFSQATSRALGGTSVLIVVGVALDTMRQMESQMMMRSYEGFLR